MLKTYIRVPKNSTDEELMYIDNTYYIGNILTGYDDKDYIITAIEEHLMYKETQLIITLTQLGEGNELHNETY